MLGLVFSLTSCLKEESKQKVSAGTSPLERREVVPPSEEDLALRDLITQNASETQILESLAEGEKYTKGAVLFNQYTLPHLALMYNKPRLFRALINLGHPLDQKSGPKKQNYLMIALENGISEVLEFIQEHPEFKPSQKDYRDKTLSHYIALYRPDWINQIETDAWTTQDKLGLSPMDYLLLENPLNEQMVSLLPLDHNFITSSRPFNSLYLQIYSFGFSHIEPHLQQLNIQSNWFLLDNLIAKKRDAQAIWTYTNLLSDEISREEILEKYEGFFSRSLKDFFERN